MSEIIPHGWDSERERNGGGRERDLVPYLGISAYRCMVDGWDGREERSARDSGCGSLGGLLSFFLPSGSFGVK